MNHRHTELIRALVAAQVAVIEHADEDISVNVAKAALVKCIERALKLAKGLD